MTLKEYLRLNNLRTGEFARMHDLPHASLYRFLSGQSTLADETKLKIEIATDGLVSAGDLVQRITGGNPPSAGASSGGTVHRPALSSVSSDGTPNSTTGEH